MPELVIKEEHVDYVEEFVPLSETKEENGSTSQPKDSFSSDVKNKEVKTNQPNSSVEQINQVMSSESKQDETASSSICHNLQTPGNENVEIEVFNIQEDLEITIDHVKIEADNWANNEPCTPEKIKDINVNDCLTKECESSENNVVDEKCIINIQEDIVFTIEDDKTLVCREGNELCAPEEVKEVNLNDCLTKVCESSKNNVVDEKGIINIHEDIEITIEDDKTLVCREDNVNSVPETEKQVKTNGRYCAFKGCWSKTNDSTVNFFWFPIHSEELIKKWAFNCGDENLLQLPKPALEKKQVCEKHFTKEAFQCESVLGRSLKLDAVPSKLLCDDDSDNQDHVNGTLSKEETENQSSKHSVLFSDYCDSLCPPQESSKISESSSQNKKDESENQSSTLSLLFHDDSDSLHSSQDATEISELTPQDKEEETENLTCTPSLLFSDYLDFCPPQDNTEITKSSSQEKRKFVDEVQKPLTCQDEIAKPIHSSSCSTFDVKPPARTYVRTAPKRMRPLGWGDAENREENQEKVAKTDTYTKLYSGKEINDLSSTNGTDKIKVVISALPTSSESSKNTVIPSTSVHSCLYCSTLDSEMKQHLLEVHTNEEEVKLLHKQIKNHLVFLTRVGDFKHNSRVLEQGNGFLIGFGGRCHGPASFDTFSPCPNCTCFFHVQQLSHHDKQCLCKDIPLSSSIERNILSQSMAMLAYSKRQKFSNMTRHISRRLKSNFGIIAKQDELIMLLIPYIFNNNGQDTGTALLVLQRLGFILQLYRKVVDDENITFHQILKPECIELLLKALHLFFAEVKETDRAVLYSNIYSHITICAFIWRGKCFADGDLKSGMEALEFFCQFTDMYKKEFNINVGNRPEKKSGMNHSESTRKPILNTAEKVLSQGKTFSPAEIINFKNLLNEKILKMTSTLHKRDVSEGPLKRVWQELAENTMCLLCLTNPVDFLAIEGIKLTEYAVRPDSSIDDLTKYKSMIHPYHMFSTKYVFVCTEYLDREIVITLSPIVKRAIDTLIMRRSEAKIPSVHPKIFSGCHDSAISAVNTFYRICIKQGKVFPEDVLRDLRKRRQISNIIHISNLSCKEVELVKDQLKTLNVQNYSLHTSPEECYKSNIEQEFLEALQSFEISRGGFDDCNKKPNDSVILKTTLDSEKHYEKNEMPYSENVESGSTTK